MISYDNVTKENIKHYYPNWPQILDHPYRILIIGGSGSGKINALLNLIKKKQDDGDYSIIDKIYLYVKNPIEATSKHQIKISEKMVLKISKSKGFY